MSPFRIHFRTEPFRGSIEPRIVHPSRVNGQARRIGLMKNMRWYLFFAALYLVCSQGKGLALDMYVTDRLYLSLRSAPDPELPAATLLPSDTKVEVVGTEGDWAEVKLEDGKTGWVMKKFLTNDFPARLTNEELKRQVENKSAILEKLEKENASLRKQISEQVMTETKSNGLKKKIETLQNQIAEQKKRLEVTTKENTVERLKEVYVAAIVALFVGLVIGYLVRRPKKRQMFS